MSKKGPRGVELLQGEVITLAALAARTAGANGTAFYIGGERRRFIVVNRITVSAHEAGDTLDVYIDFSLDNSVWYNAIHFTQQAGNGAARTEFAVLDPSNPGAAVVALAADAVDEIVDEALAAHKTQNTLGAAMSSVEMCCEKSDGAVLLGDDPLFTIAGGPIKILEIIGIVTTPIGAGATNVKLQLDTTEPAATVEMNAGAVDIDADAAGTSYRSINTTGIFTPVTAGFVLEANSFATNPTSYLAPIGTIQFNSDAARAGVIKWYLRYKPLSPNSVVTAAA